MITPLFYKVKLDQIFKPSSCLKYLFMIIFNIIPVDLTHLIASSKILDIVRCKFNEKNKVGAIKMTRPYCIDLKSKPSLESARKNRLVLFVSVLTPQESSILIDLNFPGFDNPMPYKTWFHKLFQVERYL